MYRGIICIGVLHVKITLIFVCVCLYWPVCALAGPEAILLMCGPSAIFFPSCPSQPTFQSFLVLDYIDSLISFVCFFRESIDIQNGMYCVLVSFMDFC